MTREIYAERGEDVRRRKAFNRGYWLGVIVGIFGSVLARVLQGALS